MFPPLIVPLLLRPFGNFLPMIMSLLINPQPINFDVIVHPSRFEISQVLLAVLALWHVGEVTRDCQLESPCFRIAG